jgi:hypothetical protein
MALAVPVARRHQVAPSVHNSHIPMGLLPAIGILVDRPEWGRIA